MPKKRPSKKKGKGKSPPPAGPSTEAVEQFLDAMDSPMASVMDELEIRGAAFPHPDELTDEALPKMLWRLIKSMAILKTYLMSTDHLDDRALYRHLWKDSLREASHIHTPDGMQGGVFIDLLGSGSNEDIDLWLRFYANDEDRRDWANEGEKLPERETPAFDRDRFLPKCGRPFDAGPRFHPKKWRAPKPEEYRRGK